MSNFVDSIKTMTDPEYVGRLGNNGRQTLLRAIQYLKIETKLNLVAQKLEGDPEIAEQLEETRRDLEGRLANAEAALAGFDDEEPALGERGEELANIRKTKERLEEALQEVQQLEESMGDTRAFVGNLFHDESDRNMMEGQALMDLCARAMSPEKIETIKGQPLFRKVMTPTFESYSPQTEAIADFLALMDRAADVEVAGAYVEARAAKDDAAERKGVEEIRLEGFEKIQGAFESKEFNEVVGYMSRVRSLDEKIAESKALTQTGGNVFSRFFNRVRGVITGQPKAKDYEEERAKLIKEHHYKLEVPDRENQENPYAYMQAYDAYIQIAHLEEEARDKVGTIQKGGYSVHNVTPQEREDVSTLTRKLNLFPVVENNGRRVLDRTAMTEVLNAAITEATNKRSMVTEDYETKEARARATEQNLTPGAREIIDEFSTEDVVRYRREGLVLERYY